MGFYTLDESFAFSPFRRDRIFVKGFYRSSVAAGSTDWNTSLWMDDTLTADKGEWSGSQGDRSYATSALAPFNTTCVPYIDDSGDPNVLKFMFGYVIHPGDDFEDLMEGERVCFAGGGCGSAGDNVHKTATGIAFDGHDLVTGTHTIRFEVKHDHSKVSSRLWWTYTVVMNCTESSTGVFDIYWYVARKNGGGGSSPAPTTISAAHAIAQSGGSGVTYWVAMGWRWTVATKVWSVVAEDQWWRTLQPNSNTHTTALGDGSGVEKTMSQYYVDSDTDDHTMWEVTTAST